MLLHSTTLNCICLHCGKSFHMPPSVLRKGHGHYCSRACAATLQVRTPVEPRFWPKVKKTEECWLWTGARNKKGYGIVARDGHCILAHRVSWELQYGPIPNGLCVLHHCDVPACVRLDHLFLGTRADNVADKMLKRRHRSLCGEAHPEAKLTITDVRAIRAPENQRVPSTVLARQFNVSSCLIRRVRTGRSWSHV